MLLGKAFIEGEEMAELAGVLVGNYFLLECLAREGIAEKYCARPTTKGGYDVVLRLFRPQFPDPTSFREGFANEVEKVWRCRHEHIQPLLEFGAGEDLLYCATVLSEEETLEQYLKRRPGQVLPVPQALDYASQLCAALQYAHEQGIVHGNIQASSVLMRDQEHVMLTHFGMRSAYVDGQPLVSQINEGNAAYIAPEQALGMIRPASDVYAMGVLLFRLLSGKLPYDGENAEATALLHANEPIPSLRALRPDLPEALELVVRVALSKSPEARFASPAALAQALHSAVLPESQLVIPTTPERRIAVRSRRTHFRWPHVASFLALSMLLFSLFGVSIFVFSLPQRMYDLTGLPFLNIGQSGISSHMPGNGSSTLHATPTTYAATPTATDRVRMNLTPTVNVAPVIKGTVDVSPIPSAFNCVSGTLSVNGSQNLGALLQQVDGDYQKLCPKMTISLGTRGNRYALNALQQNLINVAATDLSARPGRNLTDHPIGAMLYAIILSPDVHIGDLSSATLQDIYQGRITNWSEVGGPDEPITVFQRLANDTVTAIFRTFVLNGASEEVKGTRLKKGWAQAVAQTPGAISYVSRADAQAANVSLVAINGVLPGVQALVQGRYPFWSVEHLYTKGDRSAQFQAFLSFLVSEQEAQVFTRVGAVPISMLSNDVLASHLPGPEI
jgi:ABC-type phosphate transport system substrate-binding protein